MDPHIFYILLFFVMFLSAEAFEAPVHCPTVKCGPDGPNIRFPFRLEGGRQPQECGNHSGYKLFCKDNSTIIHFPSHGDLFVKSISYDTKRIHLLDPRNCVHKVFLNLNLSLTPFRYYYIVKNYTCLNCSTKLPPSNFLQVPCLSGSRHHVYTVESSTLANLPVSCRAVKSVAIPFSYSPYLNDNSFGLELTWSLNGYEAKKGFRSTVSSIKQIKVVVVSTKIMKSVLFILAATITTLTSIKMYMYYLKNLEEQTTEKERLVDEVEVPITEHSFKRLQI